MVFTNSITIYLLMNLLSFLAIVLGVTAVMQALKLLRQHHSGAAWLKYFRSSAFRVAIVPNKRPSAPTAGNTSVPTQSGEDNGVSLPASVMGATAARSPHMTIESPIPSAPATTHQITGGERTLSPEASVYNAGDEDGAEIGAALADATFDDFSGQHIPRVQVLSEFSQAILDQAETAGLPVAGGVPTIAQADSLYTAVQASVSRIETQMYELYALQLRLLAQTALPGGASGTDVATEEAAGDSLPGEDFDKEADSFGGGGLSAQLGEADSPPSS